MSRYPYAEHDEGIVLTQPRPGEFERRPMTTAELEAREPALKIAKDIYRHANQAGVCYFEFWKLIADAVDAGIAKAARPEVVQKPLDMLLFCPRCNVQHVDRPQPEQGWTNPPHATHTCQSCGLLWRPSNGLTNGIRMLPLLEDKHRERILASYPQSQRAEQIDGHANCRDQRCVQSAACQGVTPGCFLAPSPLVEKRGG